jgi:hypothetical protein
MMFTNFRKCLCGAVLCGAAMGLLGAAATASDAPTSGSNRLNGLVLAQVQPDYTVLKWYACWKRPNGGTYREHYTGMGQAGRDEAHRLVDHFVGTHHFDGYCGFRFDDGDQLRPESALQ